MNDAYRVQWNSLKRNNHSKNEIIVYDRATFLELFFKLKKCNIKIVYSTKKKGSC